MLVDPTPGDTNPNRRRLRRRDLVASRQVRGNESWTRRGGLGLSCGASLGQALLPLNRLRGGLRIIGISLCMQRRLFSIITKHLYV